jgi:dipeptidyl aminopeptidase/acylaminoacyl peptidase
MEQQQQQPTPRPIEPDNFIKYRTISRPNFSPDGLKVAISVHQANKDEDIYNSDIVVLSLDGSWDVTRFTYGGKDYSPKFSPDGKNLLFLSRRTMGKEEKGSELYIASVATGGEPRRLLKRKEGIESPEWSPDSKSIYFISKVFDQELQDTEEKDGIKVVRRIGVWFNGEGFVHNLRKHVFSIDVDTGNISQLIRGDFDVSVFHLSNDGKSLGYVASTDDMRPYITDLFVVDSKAKTQAKMITRSDMMISDFTWSPDDNQIAMNGAYYLPRGFASNSRIFLAEPKKEGTTISKIEDIDRNKGNSLNSDSRQSPHGTEVVLWEGEYVYYLQAASGSVHLYRLNVREQEPELLVGGERSIEQFDVSTKSGERVAFVSMDSTHLQELFLLEGGSEKKITSFNDLIYEELEIAAPEHFSFKASDGAFVDGWIIVKGKESKENKKIPTIVYVHGGPKTSFGNSYMHEFQTFAAKGYAVLYGNIRGSDGYSEEFADIRGHYGERDFKDLLEMVEFACAKFEFIDADRIAIAGGSYGGFMTNWAVGHTNIFKAAITDRSIASWETFFCTSDIGPSFTKDQIGADLFSGRDQLEKMSPIRYAPNIKTPLLIVHSMEDYRCWMVEGLGLFTALKYLGKEVELILFPEENHDLSRAGKPKHRIARLNHYMRWFDKYLKK